MGLMDKVKAQATQLAQKSQEAAAQGKARLDQVQANRHADVLFRNLGAAVYAEQTGRGGTDNRAKIDKLVQEISAHEKENGLNLGDQPEAGVPQQNFPQDESGPSGTSTTFPPES